MDSYNGVDTSSLVHVPRGNATLDGQINGTITCAQGPGSTPVLQKGIRVALSLDAGPTCGHTFLAEYILCRDFY